jgi:hypothetical protein
MLRRGAQCSRAAALQVGTENTAAVGVVLVVILRLAFG